MSSSGAQYFLTCLEEAYGFPMRYLEEIEPRWLWRVGTPEGGVCLKCFRKRNEAVTSAAAGQYVREHGFDSTPRVIPTKEGRLVVGPGTGNPAWYAVLFEWVPDAMPLSEVDAERRGPYMEDVGRTLARFHVAIRGFGEWPLEHSVDGFLSRWERVRRLTELLKAVLSEERRIHIAKRLATGLALYEPMVASSKARAEQLRGSIATVLESERASRAQRHCDTIRGNFLISPKGVTLLDLAEVEPGPRVQDVASAAWALAWDDDEAVRTLRAYQVVAPLSDDEIALIPIVRDPVLAWGTLLEGYLSGDWTEDMLTAYCDGSVSQPERISQRLDVVARELRNLPTDGRSKAGR